MVAQIETSRNCPDFVTVFIDFLSNETCYKRFETSSEIVRVCSIRLCNSFVMTLYIFAVIYENTQCLHKRQTGIYREGVRLLQ